MIAKEHKQQKISQIFLPLTLAVIASAAAAYFILSGIAENSLDHRVWGDISAILMLLPFLVLLVFKLIFLLLFILMVSKTNTMLSEKFPLVNSFVEKTLALVTRTTRAAVKPVIMGESALASLTRKPIGKEEQEKNG